MGSGDAERNAGDLDTNVDSRRTLVRTACSDDLDEAGLLSVDHLGVVTVVLYIFVSCKDDLIERSTQEGWNNENGHRASCTR